MFVALVGSERRVWLGSDGSGLVQEARGPVRFFTDDAEDAWKAAGAPRLEHRTETELFAPGCLVGRTGSGNDPVRAFVEDRSDPPSLTALRSFLGEADVGPDLRHRVYLAASESPNVSCLRSVRDELGREGCGLIAVEHGERVVLVFDRRSKVLLGYQCYAAGPAIDYAPAGTLVSWVAYTDRQSVPTLPAGHPSIPDLPCTDPDAVQHFAIRPGYVISTGCTAEPISQLAALMEAQIITRRERDHALAALVSPDRG
jgi:hypothetical protein